MDNNSTIKVDNSIIPKGILVVIGGNEDKKYELKIFHTMMSLVKKDRIVIEIITTASRYPEEIGEDYYNVFTKNKHNIVKLMHIRTREEASEIILLDRIAAADIIFFTGGDQVRIRSILGGSLIEKEIIRKYREEFCIISGSSAGATVMTKTMICGGDSMEGLLKGNVKIAKGIGLIDKAVIDTHFIERGRFSRLMAIVSSDPRDIGIGLGEDSGVIIQNGNILRAIGDGITVIFDGQNIKHSNVSDIESNEAIAIENLIIHTLVNGYGYDLDKRKYLRPEDLKREFN